MKTVLVILVVVALLWLIDHLYHKYYLWDKDDTK